MKFFLGICSYVVDLFVFSFFSVFFELVALFGFWRWVVCIFVFSELFGYLLRIKRIYKNYFKIESVYDIDENIGFINLK